MPFKKKNEVSDHSDSESGSESGSSSDVSDAGSTKVKSKTSSKGNSDKPKTKRGRLSKEEFEKVAAEFKKVEENYFKKKAEFDKAVSKQINGKTHRTVTINILPVPDKLVAYLGADFINSYCDDVLSKLEKTHFEDGKGDVYNVDPNKVISMCWAKLKENDEVEKNILSNPSKKTIKCFGIGDRTDLIAINLKTYINALYPKKEASEKTKSKAKAK